MAGATTPPMGDTHRLPGRFPTYGPGHAISLEQLFVS
jgi:hypothetical protein